MNSAPSHHWWLCAGDVQKALLIDNLCVAGNDALKHVAVLTVPEKVIGNLTVAENILLPSQWRTDNSNADLHDALLQDCLKSSVLPHQTLSQFYREPGARLTNAQRRLVGVARAIFSRANYLVVEDDAHITNPLADQRIDLLHKALPGAELHVVSLRKPTHLPPSWIIHPEESHATP